MFPNECFLKVKNFQSFETLFNSDSIEIIATVNLHSTKEGIKSCAGSNLQNQLFFKIGGFNNSQISQENTCGRVFS